MLNMFHKVVWFGISLESGDKVITVPPEGDMNVWTKFHGSPFHYWCQKWEIQQSHWDSFSGDHECVLRISWQSINSSWNFSKVVERLTNKQTNPLSNIFTSKNVKDRCIQWISPKIWGDILCGFLIDGWISLFSGVFHAEQHCVSSHCL